MTTSKKPQGLRTTATTSNWLLEELEGLWLAWIWLLEVRARVGLLVSNKGCACDVLLSTEGR